MQHVVHWNAMKTVSNSSILGWDLNASLIVTTTRVIPGCGEYS